MKNKLTEIIREVSISKKVYGQYVEDVAEKLIAEGVILTPCKVGKTLYFLYNRPYADKPDLTPLIYKTTNWYFNVDKTGIYINTIDIHSFNKEYDYHLGKNVFRTREEAEKALAEITNG
jgi:hypothetical protein